jgi:hypothetical protein
MTRSKPDDAHPHGIALISFSRCPRAGSGPPAAQNTSSSAGGMMGGEGVQRAEFLFYFMKCNVLCCRPAAWALAVRGWQLSSCPYKAAAGAERQGWVALIVGLPLPDEAT